MRLAIYVLIVLHFARCLLRKTMALRPGCTMHLGLELGTFQYMEIGTTECMPAKAVELAAILNDLYAADVEEVSGCRPARFRIRNTPMPARLPDEDNIIKWSRVAAVCKLAGCYAQDFCERHKWTR